MTQYCQENMHWVNAHLSQVYYQINSNSMYHLSTCILHYNKTVYQKGKEEKSKTMLLGFFFLFSFGTLGNPDFSV